MDGQSRALVAAAAASGFLAVSAGAFGAHGVVEPQAKALLETGAHYQLIHALAAMVCALLGRQGLSRSMLNGWVFLARPKPSVAAALHRIRRVHGRGVALA